VAESSQQRRYLVELEDVEAQFPFLQDLVMRHSSAAPGRQFKQAGISEALWRMLIYPTSPLDPGMGKDWLYTGISLSVLAGECRLDRSGS
jgi:hypothetical protein